KGPGQGDINRLLVEHARDGKRVVRLKSGDPGVFGRLGEEIDALREAAIEFEIVPGVTAALAAAAAAQISLTRRGVAASLTFTTASLAEGRRESWQSLLQPHTTLAIYMPGSDYGLLAAELLAAGASADLPAA